MINALPSGSLARPKAALNRGARFRHSSVTLLSNAADAAARLRTPRRLQHAIRMYRHITHTRLLRIAAILSLLGLPMLRATAQTAPPATRPATQPAPQKAAELFERTKVWTVHLTFTADQWAAMEPKATPGFGAMFGGGAGGGGRGFGWSTLLAPLFLRDGDADSDGSLSQAEFRTLAEKWFAAWDKDKAGKLTADQLRAGLTATLAPPPEGPAAARVSRGVGINLRGSEGKRNGIASVMGVEFDYVHADLDFNGHAIKDIAVRYKGNGTFLETRTSLKRSLKLDFNRHTEGQTFAGLTGVNLHNCVTDAGWMNEVLSYQLYRDAGVPAPRTAYARVYVTVPGKHDRAYFGLYSLVEDVGKAFAKDRFGTTDGAILKPVAPDLFSHVGDDWAKYNQTYDPKTKLTDAQKRRVIEFARLVSSAGDEEFAARLGDYLDLEAFARYMAVTVYLSTLDSILMVGQNYYVHLDAKTNKFQLLPWDLDHSFGQFPMIPQDQREQLSIHKPWRGDNRFLARVFAVESFRTLYLARLEEFTQAIFKPERIHRQVDETAAAIRDAVRDESATKLAAFDKLAAGESVQRGGGGFMRPPPTKPIKPFVTARFASLTDQLTGVSTGKTLDSGMGFGDPARAAPGIAMFLSPTLLGALDADKDSTLTRTEMLDCFGQWFETWDTQKAGKLTDDQLRTGIDKAFSRSRRGPATAPAGG